MQRKIVRISALCSEGRNLDNPLFVFWEKWWLHKFILKLADLYLWYIWFLPLYSGQKIECMMHASLPKQLNNQFMPVRQRRQQTLRAYCPNIYTVPMWILRHSRIIVMYNAQCLRITSQLKVNRIHTYKAWIKGKVKRKFISIASRLGLTKFHLLQGNIN